MKPCRRNAIGLIRRKDLRACFSLSLWLFFLLSFVGAGCSTFNQRFYAVSTDGDMSNYYRTAIGGWTFLSVSEFQTGAAPTEIVDRLLGQPASNLFAPAGADSTKTTADVAQSQAEGNSRQRSVKLVDPFTGKEMPAQKIVIALSSDPDAIFQALQGAVASDEVSNSLQRIILGQRAATVVSLRSDAQRQRLEIQKLINQLNAEQAKYQGANQQTLIELLQRLVAGLD